MFHMPECNVGQLKPLILEVVAWIFATFDNNLEIKNYLRNYWRKVVYTDLMNISPLNIFLNTLPKLSGCSWPPYALIGNFPGISIKKVYLSPASIV